MRVLLGVVSAAVIASLAACGRWDAPAIEPAPSAKDAACTALLQRLPASLLGRAAGSTDVLGTAVWGKPAIVLRCGVTPPGPSSDLCINVNNVDWLFTENASSYVFTTYGRTPALELTVPHQIDRTQASGATAQLTAAVKPLPVNRRCVSPDGT